MSRPGDFALQGYLAELLCGEVNLYEEDEHGVQQLRPHPLQVSKGVCAHSDPVEWARRTEGAPGPYAGTIGPNRDDDHWPVHVWAAPRVRKQPDPGERPPLWERYRRAVRFDVAARLPVVLPVPAPMAPDAMARKWGDEEQVAHPAPEMVGEWAPAVELAPAPVLKLAELAREAGWEVRMRAARGTAQHSTTGRPTSLQQSVAISFSQHPLTDAAAVAVYGSPVARKAWSWGSVWMWGPDLPHFGQAGVTELTEWLLAGGGKGAEWFAEIAERRAGQAAAAKLKAKTRTAAGNGGAKRESGG